MDEDDDLFDIETDALIHSNNLLTVTEPSSSNRLEPSDIYRFTSFNCTGENSPKNSNLLDGFVKRNEVKNVLTQHENHGCPIDFVGDFGVAIETLKTDIISEVLFKRARMYIQMLTVASREDSKTILFSEPSLQIRLYVTRLLFYYRYLLIENKIGRSIVRRGISILEPQLCPVECWSTLKIIHNAILLNGHKSNTVSDLVHGQLEWRWYHLTISYELEKKINDYDYFIDSGQSLSDSNFERLYKLFIYDLLCLAVIKFNQLQLAELIYSNPFHCCCIKELWILLEMLSERLAEMNQINTFWSYFNKSLELFRDGKSGYTEWNTNYVRTNSASITPTNWFLFSVWILNGVSQLQGYDSKGHLIGPKNNRVKENFELLQMITKAFFNQPEIPEIMLRAYEFMIFPLLTEWWSPKSDIVMVLWDFFHKKLNSPFYLPGSAPSTLAVSASSPVLYLRSIESLLKVEQINPNQTSFYTFIIMIGKLLDRFYITDQKGQIQRIIGRIFSKFTTSKLMALNETGIHNVVSLFLTLAIAARMSDIVQRIQNFLLQIQLNKVVNNRQVALMKGHVALLIICIERKIDISNYATRVIEQTNGIRLDDGYLPVVKCLADGVQEIINNSNTFELSEYILLDSWLVNYLQSGTPAECDRLLCGLNRLLQKLTTFNVPSEINNQNNTHQLLQCVFKYLLPYVKQTFGQCNHSILLAEVAANLSLCASGSNRLPKFEDIFKYFVDVNCINIETTIRYLVIIWSSEKLQSIDQSLVVRMWIKCSILSSNNCNDDMKKLTNTVVTLEEFRIICDVEASDIINSKDPLCSFMSEIGQSYNKITDYKKKYLISEKFHNYLLYFDKWAIPETIEATLRIYSMIGIILLNCAQIVYIRAKSSCFFNTVMHQYILPVQILMGKPPKPFVAPAVHRILHLIVLGFEKLDYKNDVHLGKLLNDIIVKWIPYMKISNQSKIVAKPYISCINKCSEQMATLIFEKLSANYLVLQRRQPHQFCCLVLTIYDEILQDIKNNEEKLQILLNTSSVILLEHTLMADEMVPSRGRIFDFYAKVFSGLCYRESLILRGIISNAVKSVISRHLSYYSMFIFEFLLKLLKINRDIVAENINYLRHQIISLENVRGVEKDNKLRNQLDKLEGALLAVTNL